MDELEITTAVTVFIIIKHSTNYSNLSQTALPH